MPVIGPAGGASLWTPLDAPPGVVQGWWDASDDGTLTGWSAATAWRDKSSFSRTLTTAAGTVSRTRSAPSGAQTLDFASASMTTAAAIWSLPTSTVFAAVKLDTASGTQQLVDGVGTSTPNRHTILTVSSTWRIFQGVSIIDSGIATSTNPAIITGIFTGGSTTHLRVDGVAGTAGSAGTATWTALGVGEDTTAGGVTQALDGWIGAIIVCIGSLPLELIRRFESYLSGRFGIPVAHGACTPPLVFQ